MKLRFATLLLIATSFVSATGFAQSTVTEGNVPFPFYLGDMLMPSGNYVVRALSDHAVQITRTDGKEQQISTILSKGAAPGLIESRMVFDHFDGGYVLSAIVDANKAVRIDLPTSRVHHELARKHEADSWQYEGSK